MLDVPRDRNGSFESEIVKNNQTRITAEIEVKILSLFALGNNYSQISKHIEYFYCIGFSKATINAVTNKIIPMLKEWNGRYISKAFYTVLRIRVDGKKEILVLYLNESEGAKFWLQVLTDLHNCGIQDIYS